MSKISKKRIEELRVAHTGWISNAYASKVQKQNSKDILNLLEPINALEADFEQYDPYYKNYEVERRQLAKENQKLHEENETLKAALQNRTNIL
jgi:hypothetical protein